jgi:TRAP transporter 4TM/12TM fusion protein
VTNTSTGKLFLTALLAMMSIFHLWTGTFGTLEPLIQRLIHIGFGTSLLLLTSPTLDKNKWTGVVDRYAKLVILGLFLLYLAYFFSQYKFLSGERYPYIMPLTLLQVIIGTAMVVAILDASRRCLGWSLPIFAMVFMLYAMAGKYLPGALHHSGYSWNTIIDNLAFTTDGILGIAIAITATYVVLFVIFGCFLMQAGFGDLLMNLTMGLAGRFRGGPGKMSVIAAGLMGMVNGSAVACSLTVGSITLPLMIKTGYDPEYAAGAVAVGGSGGQIMPPVMGAQAFLMSQFTGIPYIDIAKLSFLPAVFYYFGIWMGLDVEARKRGLQGIAADEIPKDWKHGALVRIHLILPLLILVLLLIQGYTPMLAVVYSIFSIVLIGLVRKETRLTLPKIMKALEDGASMSLSVISATAVAGIIIGMVTMTGIGERFSLSILGLAGGNVLAALLLTMIVSIFLGMGLPTVPAYIVQVSMIIPALVKLGIPLYIAHMFAIYWACVSMITPPVAIAAYATAGLVQGNPSRVGWKAFRLGLTAYVIPYVFVYHPGLLLKGTIFEIGYAILLAIAISVAVAIGIGGFWNNSLRLWERALYFVAATLLITTSIPLNMIGAACLLFALFLQSPQATRWRVSLSVK